jgi:hypothetical protein
MKLSNIDVPSTHWNANYVVGKWGLIPSVRQSLEISLNNIETETSNIMCPHTYAVAQSDAPIDLLNIKQALC